MLSAGHNFQQTLAFETILFGKEDIWLAPRDIQIFALTLPPVVDKFKKMLRRW